MDPVKEYDHTVKTLKTYEEITGYTIRIFENEDSYNLQFIEANAMHQMSPECIKIYKKYAKDVGTALLELENAKESTVDKW